MLPLGSLPLSAARLSLSGWGRRSGRIRAGVALAGPRVGRPKAPYAGRRNGRNIGVNKRSLCPAPKCKPTTRTSWRDNLIHYLIDNPARVQLLGQCAAGYGGQPINLVRVRAGERARSRPPGAGLRHPQSTRIKTNPFRNGPIQSAGRRRPLQGPGEAPWVARAPTHRHSKETDPLIGRPSRRGQLNVRASLKLLAPGGANSAH